MGDVTRLVLIRHGEARAALERVVGGDRGCTGLSDRGRAQAEALRDRLVRTGEVAADVLLSSTLPRAIETAEILSPSLGRLPVVTDCDLCELHPGECDALSWEEYDARYGVDMANDLYAPMSPGGESLADFVLRVGRTLNRLAKEHEGRTVVAACHGGVVIGSMITFLSLPLAPALRPDLFVENTSITEWMRRDGRWSLVRFNDMAHLAELDGSTS